MRVHADWLLTPERALVHVPSAAAVIADPHLGYCEARRRAGDAVPAAGLEEVARAMRRIQRKYRIRRLIVAGDLVENRAGREQAIQFQGWLQDAGIELALVAGNHDRGLADSCLPVHDEVTIGNWRIAHGDRRVPVGNTIIGHHHPALRLPGRPAAPCYLIAARRMILPAFSQDASGTNVLRSAGWSRYRCIAIAGDRLLDFGTVGKLNSLFRFSLCPRRLCGKSPPRRVRTNHSLPAIWSWLND